MNLRNLREFLTYLFMLLIPSIFRHGFPVERLLLSAFLLSVFGAVSVAVAMTFLQRTLLAAEAEEGNLAQMELAILLTVSALKDLEIVEREHLLKHERHRNQAGFDEARKMVQLKTSAMTDSFNAAHDQDLRTSIDVVSGLVHKRIDELSDSIESTERADGVHETVVPLQDAVERLTMKLSSQRRHLDEQAQRYGQQMVRAVAAASSLVVLALVIAYSFIHVEVRARREAAFAEAHAARHDLLTGLPNRTLFLEWMNHVLANAKRESSASGLMYIDLDGFKTINDTLGHKAGDQALVFAAHRFQEVVRDGDMVARLGGDEFAVLIPHVDDIVEMHALAQRLINGLREGFQIEEKTLSVGASIGLAISEKTGTSSETLIASADKAMYRAKLAGKNCFCCENLEPDTNS